MGPHFGDFTRSAVEYFVKRAEGGAALLLVNIQVTDYFEDSSATSLLNDENVAAFKEIVDRAHAYGCKVGVQLMPGCGRMAGPAKQYGVQFPLRIAAGSMHPMLNATSSQ